MLSGFFDIQDGDDFECVIFVPLLIDLGLTFLCGRLRASKESSISSKVGEETEEELDRSSICSEFMHNHRSTMKR